MENKKRPVEFDRCQPNAACAREIRETLQGVELPFPDQGPREKNNDDDKG
jgi:hypothetical protein